MPVSDLPDALTDVVTRLEAIGVDYMLTGSAAACLYGVMRTPADIDFVVDLGNEQAEHLVESFSADHYIEPGSVAHAVEKGCAFHAIPLVRGLKADFTVLRDDPFGRAAFARRQSIHREAGAIWAITAADLVINNLRWTRTRRAGQQLADVRTIMASGLVEEDDEFRDWIDRLRLQDLLDASRTTRYDA